MSRAVSARSGPGRDAPALFGNPSIQPQWSTSVTPALAAATGVVAWRSTLNLGASSMAAIRAAGLDCCHDPATPPATATTVRSGSAVVRRERLAHGQVRRARQHRVDQLRESRGLRSPAIGDGLAKSLGRGGTPPMTGASSSTEPLPATVVAKPRVAASEIADRSITTSLGRAASATPPNPSSTARATASPAGIRRRRRRPRGVRRRRPHGEGRPQLGCGRRDRIATAVAGLLRDDVGRPGGDIVPRHHIGADIGEGDGRSFRAPERRVSAL